MDYYCVYENGYIINVGNQFYSYSFSGTYNNYECIEYDNRLVIKTINEQSKDINAILLLSEIMFYKGHKRKDVNIVSATEYALDDYGFRKEDNVYKKKVEAFREERKKKCLSINDLYSFPRMVPWNLVEIEHDVIDIMMKYTISSNSILDIGSGYGKNLYYLNKIGYSRVQGIEYSHSAVELAKKTNNNIILGNVCCMPYANECFDVVLDVGCLHCISKEDRNTAIDEVKRVLRKDGIIVSRFFLTKSNEWIDLFPINVSSFGESYEYIIELFKGMKIIEANMENGCVYIVAQNVLERK